LESAAVKGVRAFVELLKIRMVLPDASWKASMPALLLGSPPASFGDGALHVRPSSSELAPYTFFASRSRKKALSAPGDVRTMLGCTRLSAFFTSTGAPHLLWFALSDTSIKGALGGPFVVQ
jgi:hypothetical protein